MTQNGTGSPQVETGQGKLVGMRDGEVVSFRGIPFAIAGRFEAPRRAGPWAGVRDATRFGNSSPQLKRRIQVLPTGAQNPLDEDCLYLNVWTPALDGGRRPVFVYVHGGAFRRGEGSSPLYHGTPLAPRGDVVVVTLNYRLGALGFLDLGSVGGRDRGASANRGLLDQVAALEWVRDHIECFGGDPANVTICGESAGAMSVGTLMGMPAARGLFQRAILQSGAAHNFLTEEAAAEVTHDFLRFFGAQGDRVSLERALDRIFGLPFDELLKAQQRLDSEKTDGLGTLWFQPTLDHETLPGPPLDAIRSGSMPDVAILLGSNLEEWNFFSFLDPAVQQLSEDGLLARVSTRIEAALGAPLGQHERQARALALVEVYAKQRPGATPGQLFNAIETDRVFRIPAIRLAEAQQVHTESVYMYLFTYASPALEGRLGACHALDIPFVFGRTRDELVRNLVGEGAHVERLSHQMMRAWLGFVTHADPNAPVAAFDREIDLPLPHWEPYRAPTRLTMELGTSPELIEDPNSRECEAWQGLV